MPLNPKELTPATRRGVAGHLVPQLTYRNEQIARRAARRLRDRLSHPLDAVQQVRPLRRRPRQQVAIHRASAETGHRCNHPAIFGKYGEIQRGIARRAPFHVAPGGRRRVERRLDTVESGRNQYFSGTDQRREAAPVETDAGKLKTSVECSRVKRQPALRSARRAEASDEFAIHASDLFRPTE